MITHEFSKSFHFKSINALIDSSISDLFKGFAANAPLKALEAVKTLESMYAPHIEHDEKVSINDE